MRNRKGSKAKGQAGRVNTRKSNRKDNTSPTRRHNSATDRENSQTDSSHA
jgi:hypothetical protein